MTQVKRTNFEDLSSKAQKILDQIQSEALIVNASGDLKVGQQVVNHGEQSLVAGLISIDVDDGYIPLGQDEREQLVKRAVRLNRKLGVERI